MNNDRNCVMMVQSKENSYCQKCRFFDDCFNTTDRVHIEPASYSNTSINDSIQRYLSDCEENNQEQGR
jgi:hypothetical protein